MRRRKVFAGLPFAVSTPGFPSPIVNRTMNETGMAYGMVFQPRVIGIEGGAQIERQSIRQPVLKHRSQASHYLSRFRVGLQAEIDYPAARGFKIINSAPPLTRRPHPQGSGRAASRPGFMGSPPRFKKALRAPVNTFSAPVYE